MHTGEKDFVAVTFKGLGVVFSGKVKKRVVYFSVFESFLHF